MSVSLQEILSSSVKCNIKLLNFSVEKCMSHTPDCEGVFCFSVRFSDELSISLLSCHFMKNFNRFSTSEFHRQCICGCGCGCVYGFVCSCQPTEINSTFDLNEHPIFSFAHLSHKGISEMEKSET